MTSLELRFNGPIAKHLLAPVPQRPFQQRLLMDQLIFNRLKKRKAIKTPSKTPMRPQHK
ncbi:hypothetical protein [Candidatus Terasakiella magnetica]|uniref:hypothetical protein n=1 Tax=Candidatus Terasakiella magnetica TaxID=1867952 RepID=UPI0013F4C6FF|nr:hypothetical protein [Candidatus Terasakiella magnetica]